MKLFIRAHLFLLASCHCVTILALQRPKAVSRISVARVDKRWTQNGDTTPESSLEHPHNEALEWVLSVRGGALEVGGSDGSSFLQSLFGSCLKALEGQSPSLATHFRSLLSTVESITGLQLLPPKKKSRKSKKDKKKKKSKAAVEEEDEVADKSSAKKKKKTAAANKKKSSSKSKSTLANLHVKKELKATSPNYRIQRELKSFLSDPPPNLKVKVGKNIRVWIVTMSGAKDTIYEGETFQLRIAFPAAYPTVPPSVYFLPPNIPLHEHVYTNGDICLSLLGKDWRPTMTAQSIAVSILSILSSAQSKSLPMDNARHSQNKPGEYQKDWVYHDDLC